MFYFSRFNLSLGEKKISRANFSSSLLFLPRVRLLWRASECQPLGPGGSMHSQLSGLHQDDEEEIICAASHQQAALQQWTFSRSAGARARSRARWSCILIHEANSGRSANLIQALDCEKEERAEMHFGGVAAFMLSSWRSWSSTADLQSNKGKTFFSLAEVSLACRQMWNYFSLLMFFYLFILFCHFS